MRLLYVFALAVTATSTAYAECSLCDLGGDRGVDALLHPTTFINSKGKTCAQLMLELFSLDRDNARCKQDVNKNYVRCCTVNSLAAIVQDPPPPPPQFTMTGPFKRCDLCVGGAYPSVTSMVINMLYIGAGSCPQYYEWGQKGWIQEHLCSTLQFFAREPCGCKVRS